MSPKFIIFSLITVFIGMTVLGFLSADCGGGTSTVCCVAPLISGDRCIHQNQLLHVNFHMNALKSFSLAIVDPIFMVSTVFMFFMVLQKVLGSQYQPNALGVFLGSLNPGWLKEIPLIEKEYRFWLALHENSPALF